jgi:transposase
VGHTHNILGHLTVTNKERYCYAHLLPEVEELRDEFSDEAEVQLFATTDIPLLAAAMHLHSQPLSDRQYYAAARNLKTKLEQVMRAAAQPLGVRRIQDLFVEKAERRYQWAEDRRVPADNNRAERELRPTVIARKVSFGSQSEAGAKTRETLMIVMQTLKKRVKDPIAHCKQVLDALARCEQRPSETSLASRDWLKRRMNFDHNLAISDVHFDACERYILIFSL